MEYFRGRPTGRKGEASTKPEQEDRNRKATERDQLERAEGDSQFDYLRRLAAEIREDTGGVYTGERRVKAIGIFGRDVYDKLLILQALWDEYPRTIFFTTDLDVRLLHPQDFRYARNLIVASGFALRLDRSRHGGIPPFRDNYQTAEFLAVQLALEGQGWTRRLAAQAMLDWAVPPRLFEIGRTAAVDLGQSERAATGFFFHPQRDRGAQIAGVAIDARSVGWAAGALGLSLVLIYLSSLRVRARVKRFLRGRGTDWPRTLRYGVGATVVLVTCGVLLWTSGGVWMGSGFLEPFAWFWRE